MCVLVLFIVWSFPGITKGVEKKGRRGEPVKQEKTLAESLCERQKVSSTECRLNMSWKAAVQRRQGLRLEITGQKSRGAGSTKRKGLLELEQTAKMGLRRGSLWDD